jgi:hypothetical protein
MSFSIVSTHKGSYFAGRRKGVVKTICGVVFVKMEEIIINTINKKKVKVRPGTGHEGSEWG